MTTPLKRHSGPRRGTRRLPAGHMRPTHGSARRHDQALWTSSSIPATCCAGRALDAASWRGSPRNLPVALSPPRAPSRHSSALPKGSARMLPPSRRPWGCHGVRDRSKGTSIACRCSRARCLAGHVSICWPDAFCWRSDQQMVVHPANTPWQVLPAVANGMGSREQDFPAPTTRVGSPTFITKSDTAGEVGKTRGSCLMDR
jgi:hypothetical protein